MWGNKAMTSTNKDPVWLYKVLQIDMVAVDMFHRFIINQSQW